MECKGFSCHCLGEGEAGYFPGAQWGVAALWRSTSGEVTPKGTFSVGCYLERIPLLNSPAKFCSKIFFVAMSQTKQRSCAGI